MRKSNGRAWTFVPTCCSIKPAPIRKSPRTRVCPAYRRRLTRLPGGGATGTARNADRLLNRHFDYPRYARTVRTAFDVFHVVDHSYSQLIHELPGERTGVLCHDIDTFRSLVEPDKERRPRWFRWMMRRVLTGMQKAAVVFHTTQAVKRDLLRFGLVDPDKLVQAPLGFAPEFHERPQSDAVADRILAELAGRPVPAACRQLHSAKRVDFLLSLFAEACRRFADLQLVKVGGDWQRDHLDFIQPPPSLRRDPPCSRHRTLHAGRPLPQCLSGS